MSIRMKLANWLSGGEIESLRGYSANLQSTIGRLRLERATMPVSLSHKDAEIEKLRDAIKRIYDTPCGPKSNGTQRKIRRIAAHALWKE